MAVSAITQGQLSQPVAEVQKPALTKAQSGAAKANTAEITAREARTGEPQGVAGSTAAENNAGREQGGRQGAGNDETTGTLVDLHA